VFVEILFESFLQSFVNKDGSRPVSQSAACKRGSGAFVLLDDLTHSADGDNFWFLCFLAALMCHFADELSNKTD